MNTYKLYLLVGSKQMHSWTPYVVKAEAEHLPTEESPGCPPVVQEVLDKLMAGGYAKWRGADIIVQSIRQVA